MSVYPTLKQDGSLIKSGTRINHNSTIIMAAVDLYDTETNSPENAPALWETLNYKDSYRIIPEVIIVGTTFSKGELGWWNDELYESLVDSNVYTPDQYAPNWSKQ